MKNQNQIFEHLKEFKLLQSLSLEDKKQFIQNIEIKELPKNYTIIREDSYGTFLIFLIDGQVSISRKMTLNQSENNDFQEIFVC